MLVSGENITKCIQNYKILDLQEAVRIKLLYQVFVIFGHFLYLKCPFLGQGALILSLELCISHLYSKNNTQISI